jgi:integration host factor subunit beta
MNRSDLIRAIAENENLSMGEVERTLDAIIQMIEISLACGESVLIRNFGKFECRTKRAVVRTNPKTGEKIKVPEKQAVIFHASPALKKRIN